MKNNVTELVFILDRSGSMAGLEDDTIGGFNALIEKQKSQEGKCYVSTLLFANDSRVIHDRVPLECVKPMTRADYQVGGCTALMDAMGGAIRHIRNIHRYARPEDVPEHTVFVITTDGMENASRLHTPQQVREMVQQQKDSAGWEFLFLAANIDAVQTASRFGIGADQAVNYHADSQGTRLVYESVAQAICQVRSPESPTQNWRAKIDDDFQKRSRK